MADAADSKSADSNIMSVRPRPPPPQKPKPMENLKCEITNEKQPYLTDCFLANLFRILFLFKLLNK